VVLEYSVKAVLGLDTGQIDRIFQNHWLWIQNCSASSEFLTSYCN